ncbi:MAG: T9SS type A sorting domain-containing protein [candidate division Zixibacteria bacterium]|nr:T9SS type A sorting domain-containing protein [candidate division Zixibacteria bacterium]
MKHLVKMLSFAAFALLVAGMNFSVASAESGSGGLPEITVIDTLLSENFDGPEGPFATNPLPGWTVIDNGIYEWDETSWSRYENTPYPEYWNGDLCRVLFAGTNAVADWLISPALDCSAENNVTFSFKHRHSNSSSNPDTAFVFGSTDGGSTWPYTVAMYDTSVGALNDPDTVVVDISSWAAGNTDVKVAFCLKGSYVLSWYLDEPTVEGDVSDTLLYEDFNGSWGPFGDNPPGDWTIVNETLPDPANENDFSRWYYSSWPDTVARAYESQNDQTADEWLISPTLSFSSEAVCSLSFYNSYWDHSSDPSDSAMVLGSTDGGATWPHQVVVYTNADDRSTNKPESRRAFDISSWAQGQSDVKIGFHYVKDIVSYLGWWFFDDVTVYETPLIEDNAAALSVDYPSEYIVVGYDYNSQVSVQNLGTNEDTIAVNLTIADANNVEVYNETETDIVLESLEILPVTFSTAFTPASEGTHTFTAVVINPGDGDPSDDTVQVQIYAYEHEGSGGPDAFGYEFRDNTVSGGPTYDWVDISSSGTQIEPTSHYFMSDPINMGFDFDFYGSTYNTIYVNSHGELHLGSRDSWLSTNDCPLPDLSTPNAPLLAVFWDRLYIHYEEGQGVYYQYFDEVDNDYFVIQWNAKVDGQLDDSLSFEAILYEDGDIIYQYRLVNDLPGGMGQSATVGMEYDALPSGLTYYCDDNNPANRLTEGLAIQWSTNFVTCADISMVPDNPPVYVPAGGSFGVTGIIGNPGTSPITTDVWWGVLAFGSYFEQGVIQDLMLPAGAYPQAHLVQQVPSFAPAGQYIYASWCGDYQNWSACDSFGFLFTVTRPAIEGGANEWLCLGSFGTEQTDAVPAEFSLDNNYPNPFNANTTIGYSLPEAANVQLEVYNLMGQKVETLHDGYMPAGEHQVNWDASHYSSGVYFYRLTAGDRVFTKRMTLLK